jgi:UDP-2-acetamido-2,6-beta-L-arabino-hexul-4-ose reductase
MRSEPHSIAVTGSDGFIGRNLVVRLKECGFATHPINRRTQPDELKSIIGESDAIFHLAAANRPSDWRDFERSNCDLTRAIAKAIAEAKKKPLVVFTSSVRSGEPGDYGRTKRISEELLLDLAAKGAATTAVVRLPNVFGKWAQPNYNSAIATFCHNLARGLPIAIDDPEAPLSLLYIDDLVDQFLELLAVPPTDSGLVEPKNVHHTTVGHVARFIATLAEGRRVGSVEAVGSGLERALYATLISSLPRGDFSYPLAPHTDNRGSFTEFLKTPASGQTSVLTAEPGATRGGHYHHSKVEKFLIVQGEAKFRFRNILDGATHEIDASGASPVVVETIPGWTHDLTNVGDEVLIAIIWANERFDRERPDTIALPL